MSSDDVKTLGSVQVVADGYVTAWRYALQSYSPDEVRKYCVQDSNWQVFRICLKGLSTYVKLANLERWRSVHLVHGQKGADGQYILPRRQQVQIDNYINALKRGGQLDMECKVQR
jgi:hypothetical protein